MGHLREDTARRVKKFVQCYLTNGYRSKEAAIEAGFSFKSAREIGVNLLQRYSVQKLISEYEQKDQRKFRVDRNTLCRELDEAYELAKHKKNPVAMVMATNSKMKLFGLEAPKKVEVDVDGNIDHTVKVKKIDLDERINAIVGNRVNAFMQ